MQRFPVAERLAMDLEVNSRLRWLWPLAGGAVALLLLDAARGTSRECLGVG